MTRHSRATSDSSTSTGPVGPRLSSSSVIERADELQGICRMGCPACRPGLAAIYQNCRHDCWLGAQFGGVRDQNCGFSWADFAQRRRPSNAQRASSVVPLRHDRHDEVRRARTASIDPLRGRPEIGFVGFVDVGEHLWTAVDQREPRALNLDQLTRRRSAPTAGLRVSPDGGPCLIIVRNRSGIRAADAASRTHPPGARRSKTEDCPDKR